MKYEDIKIGDVFTRFHDEKIKVISKNDEYRIITTIDDNLLPRAWKESELYMLKPVLPEEGLLVSNVGSLVYKLSDGSGYGFSYNDDFRYYFNKDWSFETNPKQWSKATKEDREKFVKLLKKECKKRGLFEDTKIEKHANGSTLSFSAQTEFTPSFNSMQAWNKNGLIFYKGKFATPLKEESTLEQVTNIPDVMYSPILAKIEHINDLGKSTWHEVVYYDGDKWCSCSGSETFKDGEQVIKWKYIKDCL